MKYEVKFGVLLDMVARIEEGNVTLQCVPAYDFVVKVAIVERLQALVEVLEARESEAK